MEGGGILVARLRPLLRAMGVSRRKKRPGGPRLREAAWIALLYWEMYRVVEWSDGELQYKPGEGAGGED